MVRAVSRPGMLETVTPQGLESSDVGLSSDVVAFQVNPTGDEDGPGTLVHVETLVRKLAELPARVGVVVFIDGSEGSIGDRVAPHQLKLMLSEYAKRKVHALVRHVMATEAVKHVDGDVVTTGVDRSSLVAVRSPEIIDRTVLERALVAVGDRIWVSPTALVAAVGGVVALFAGSLTGADGDVDDVA